MLQRAGLEGHALDSGVHWRWDHADRFAEFGSWRRTFCKNESCLPLNTICVHLGPPDLKLLSVAFLGHRLSELEKEMVFKAGNQLVGDSYKSPSVFQRGAERLPSQIHPAVDCLVFLRKRSSKGHVSTWKDEAWRSEAVPWHLAVPLIILIGAGEIRT